MFFLRTTRAFAGAAVALTLAMPASGLRAQPPAAQVVSTTFQVLIRLTGSAVADTRCLARVRTGSAAPAVRLECLALPPGAGARGLGLPTSAGDAQPWLTAGPPGAGTEMQDLRAEPHPDGVAGTQLVIWF